MWRGLARCWAATAALGAGLTLLHRVTGWWAGWVFPSFVAATVGWALVIWRRWRANEPDYREVARQIEWENPKLHALLLTAVEQQPDPATGALNYLQQRVVREALEHNRRRPWASRVFERLFFARCAHALALILFVAVLCGLWIATPASRSPLIALKQGVTVTPGDVSLERGSGLVVLARFEGNLPAEATLVLKPLNEPERRLPLAKNLDDPVFGASVPEVKSDLAYRVEFAGRQTRDFNVTVFDYPKMERADAKVTFPKYTGLPEKTIPDTRRVSAVEGSVLEYTFFLNKPVATARLVAKDKSAVGLVADTNRANVYRLQFTLEQSRHYELQLVDDAGRTNKIPPQFVIEALKNRPPMLKLASPRGDQRVSPLEEIGFQAEASDDFGLKAYGIAYALAGQETSFVELGKDAGPNEKRQFTYLLPLEDLSARPDRLLSYYLWADDIGPDGAPRRTSSDMYFAEVRPFDEIFREGPSMEGGGQQGAGNRIQKLAELQKQIINATWKLQRQEAGRTPSSQYKKDAPVVQQSQEQALEQARAMREGVDDPRAKALIENVETAMAKAVDRLSEAVDKTSTAPLPSALASEQGAYQALLKLAAREYQVSRSRGQQGGQGGEGAQRQLDQLELKEAENRYETQRQAAPQQNAEQREQLQVLNRLKELAQRQQDINERVKELQTALQEANTEEEREEIRRRLKRLREEEQEMLADLDELRQRMERPENQSRMADARQKLDQTRSEVQRASEALDNQSVPQALSSGTRAQRDLQQLSDDFRKKSSSQFADQMRQMRNDARQLAQKQEELSRNLEGLADAKQKTLSDSNERRDLAGQLAQQKAGVTNLFQEMRAVSEQSETAEPLLSKQLYDMLRQSNQEELNKSLDFSSELIQRGFLSQAGPFEQRARQNIDELKRGVERAAESVLGDDVEALRLAKRELDELSRQLEREMSQAGSNGIPTNEIASPGELMMRRRPGPGPQANSESQSAAPTDEQRKSAGQPAPPGDREGQNQVAQNSQSQSPDSSGAKQPSSGQQPGGSGSRGQDSSPNSSGDGTQQTEQQDSAQGAQASASGPGRNNPNGPPGQRAGAGGAARRNFFDRGGAEGGAEGGGLNGGPLTGNEYVDWSDRLRDVEEMLDLPELRGEVARIRDRARALRLDYRRHGEKPDWAVVRLRIASPLAEVRSRIAEELARRESNEAVVPIDRDPVPARFSELVRRYYEELGKSD